MAMCEHPKFEARVDVNRLTKVPGGPAIGFNADIKIRCAECRVEFQFMGLPPGVNLLAPAVSIDGIEARLPICPAGELEIYNHAYDTPGKPN